MLKILVGRAGLFSVSREVCDVPGSLMVTARCCVRQPRTDDWGVEERKMMKLRFCADIGGDVRLRCWVKGHGSCGGVLLLSRRLG